MTLENRAVHYVRSRKGRIHMVNPGMGLALCGVRVPDNWEVLHSLGSHPIFCKDCDGHYRRQIVRCRSTEIEITDSISIHV